MSDVNETGVSDAADSPRDDPPPSPSDHTRTPISPILAGRHINETVIPLENTPVAQRVTEATVQLRRWIVIGLGALAALILVGNPLLVLMRPELAAFALDFLQITFPSLIGLGGITVGGLFPRGKDL